jgi:tol-pal system protein YbgF
MRIHSMISALGAGLALVCAAPGPTFAQSVTTFEAPSENLTRLQNKVEELERLLMETTQAKEDLDMRLRRLEAENSALKEKLAKAEADLAAAPAPAANQAPTVALPGTSAEAFQQGVTLLQQGRHQEAEQTFTQFLAVFPRAAEAPQARYWLGRTQLVQLSYDAAMETFLTVLRTTPQIPQAADSLVRLGVALRGMGRKEEACAAFADLSVRYPNAAPGVRQLARSEAAATQCASGRR